MKIQVYNNVATCGKEIEIFDNKRSCEFEITGAMPICDFLRVTYKNSNQYKSLKIDTKEFVLNDLESGLLEITIECVIDNRTIKQIRVDKIVVCEKLGKLELIPEVEELKGQVAELKEQVTKFKELIKALYSIDIGGEEQ